MQCQTIVMPPSKTLSIRPTACLVKCLAAKTSKGKFLALFSGTYIRRPSGLSRDMGDVVWLSPKRHDPPTLEKSSIEHPRIKIFSA